jgi:hypothetical protein
VLQFETGGGGGFKKGGGIKGTTYSVEMTSEAWRSTATDFGTSSTLTVVNVCFLNLVKYKL